MINAITHLVTERAYVGALLLLNANFKEAVNQHGPGVLPAEDAAKIFGNLLELQILNSDLLKDFEVCGVTKLSAKSGRTENFAWSVLK